jgi:hypothetical protein
VTTQKSSDFIHYLKISGWVIIPMALLILPADFFDSGKSICLSVLLFDETCYGCGMTRAIQHLVHLNFSLAAHYNKISFIVLPLLVWVGITDVLSSWKKIQRNRSAQAGK